MPVSLSSISDFFAPINPVNGRRQPLSLIPEKWEIVFGKYHLKSYVVRKGVSYNKEHIQLIKDACERLKYATDRAFPYHVELIDSPVINAACFAGGNMFFNRGILEAFLNEEDDFGLGYIPLEDKIAAVMAHEMVHAAARHHARGYELSWIIFGMLVGVFKVSQYALYAFAGSTNVPGRKAAAEALADAIEWVYLYLSDTIAELMEAGYSRADEDEADLHGMVYLQRGDLNPKAMIWMQKMFMKLEVDHPIPLLNHINSWFRSHDHSKNRVLKCEKNLERVVEGRIPVSPTSSYPLQQQLLQEQA